MGTEDRAQNTLLKDMEAVQTQYNLTVNNCVAIIS